jgi:hypothetical protein
VPYSVCGCAPEPDLPPPAPPRKESFTRRLTHRLTHIRKNKGKNPLPAVNPVNTRPDLVSTEEDAANCSHPSEHNVQVQRNSREIWVQHCFASAKRGTVRDPWRALRFERNERRRERDHREEVTDQFHEYGNYYSYWGVSMAIPSG